MDKYDQYYNLTFFKFLFFETFKMYFLSEQYMWYKIGFKEEMF